MRENGTDRDIAILLVSALSTISEKLAAINGNLYSPYIHTQPTNQEVAITNYGTFSIVASHVAAYQWQYQAGGAGPWNDISTTDYPTANTADFRFYVSAAPIYLRNYRCKLTGTDGTVVYSNIVKVLEPANG